ncbi:MAG TPA: DUF3006 domain-containing protein [Gemmatimonadaceae bacterium]|jgi:hypothetical protein|nr:DUF3006 domain-containing protein [Gemmatimonadaceae bacterium]
MKHERHHWVVDVLDEDAARISVDGRQVTTIPRWLLPGGAREGDVLVVHHDRAQERSNVLIERDVGVTHELYEHPEQPPV